MLSHLQEKSIDANVKVSSAAGALVRFEVLGPKANSVVLSALHEISEAADEKLRRVLSYRSQELPPNSILGVKISDPR